MNNNTNENKDMSYSDIAIDMADTAIDEGAKYIRKFMEDTADVRHQIAKGAIKGSKTALSLALNFVNKLDSKYNK